MSLSNIQWFPSEYQAAAIIAEEAGKDLLARLSLMTVEPKVILELGCGTGLLATELQKHYPEAKLLALDLSADMLAVAKSHCPLAVQADAYRLPLRSLSVDMVVANFLLPWCEDRQAIFQECRRVLRPGGVLIFTSLGPDTLREYREYLEGSSQPHFIDMHDLGDELVHLGFADPVLDVDYYTTVFKSEDKMLAELKATGLLSLTPQYLLPPIESQWSVTYEIIHGHSWVPVESYTYGASTDGVVSVPLSMLRRKLRTV
ncbi:MAG: methyltransferase domain-containing protein [Gammaproteobacteria bacterium]